MRAASRLIWFVILGLSVGACASLQRVDPVQVSVAGVESLPGEGLELRMLVKLRVQNPNDVPIEYDGVYLKLEVMNKTFATGVSDARGSVPRFGESVIGVPVTVSVLRMARHALGVLDGKPIDKISYELDGKLNAPAFGSTRFQSQGEFALPSGTPSSSQP
ncbi:MAG: LEA type 2 family protein [Burkholderiales bacterium]|nr:LEA type 2 family protein [Burkholderiales bacterium]